MRIFLGIAVLIGVFAVSSLWHRSALDDMRNPAPLDGEVLAARPRDLPPGWGEVVIGAPSGAEAVFLEPPPRPERFARRDEEVAIEDFEILEDGESEVELQDWELIVGSGDVLSRIVRKHYGRVSPELEDLLARYNGLSSPDKLEVGQVLRLPSEERLRSQR